MMQKLKDQHLKSNENSDKCAGKNIRQLQTGDRVILRHNDN